MLYQLPNGRVVEMSVESFLELDDQAVQELTGLGLGQTIEISNPFMQSWSELDHIPYYNPLIILTNTSKER